MGSDGLDRRENRTSAASTALANVSIYKWKAKFGGIDVSEAKRLRALEDENAKLGRMLADAMLDNVARGWQRSSIGSLRRGSSRT